MWYRCFGFIFLFCLPLITGAQFDLQSFTAQPSTIVLEPTHPAPGSPVQATVNAGSGTFGSQIIWSYGGVELTDSTNQRSVELTAPAAGDTTSLQAVLIAPDGAREVINTTISPVYLDIIIEPQTRVPDWYQGRALPSYASIVNATALLHNGTTFLNRNNLIYNWQIDRQPIEGGAIRAGNKVSFATPRGNTPVLTVSVSDLQGQTIASRAVALNTATPQLYFYEKHSLYGVQNKPLKSNTTVVGSILTIRAEPYYLDTRVYNQPDIAQWEINSAVTDNGTSNPYEITLSRSGLGAATLVNYHVRSLQEVLQGVESGINLSF